MRQKIAKAIFYVGACVPVVWIVGICIADPCAILVVAGFALVSLFLWSITVVW